MIESAPGNQTDVILGGGMLSFKNGSNSNPKWVCSRQDGRDLIKGYKIDYQFRDFSSVIKSLQVV